MHASSLSVFHSYDCTLFIISRLLCVLNVYLYIIIKKKQKKNTRNPINKKYKKWFQYTVTVALNHEEIGKNPERIINLKINSFINKYKWEGIYFHHKKMIPNGTKS